MNQGGSDIVLFNRIKRDDRLALNALFNNYYNRLCRFACTCSLSYEQAEEIVSDVFFTIWKNRSRLEIHASVQSYLFKAVRNAALTIKKPIVRSDLSMAEEVVDPFQPEALMEFEELQEHLNRTVNALPERCRQVFVMNRIEGMKYREISSVLKISERTIEHHIVKALDIIRESVKQYQKCDRSAALVNMSVIQS